MHELRAEWSENRLECSSPKELRSQMENLRCGMCSSACGGDVKEVDFVKIGRSVSTKKPDKGLFVGVSGDSEESKSSIAKE